jgi:hypothetical protein
MGLQSVIKIRGKTSKLFELHVSPSQRFNPGWVIETLKIPLEVEGARFLDAVL